VLGVLRAVAPSTLLDVGTGRGAFLWPLLDAMPDIAVTAMDIDRLRVDQLAAVARGGVANLAAVRADVASLPFANGAFDVVCVLEVLEHVDDPSAAAFEAVRAASGYVVASVPSHPDDNPQHLRLFTPASLERLLVDAGAAKVNFEHVRGHMIAVARVADERAL
jgi:2-polyprenyl-3-methyl-5-hydroxy-6-metoxy-1,4-benzoquinol methylase